jgi:uncharacterized membrane protein YbhN (UPF0104 family)
VLVLVAAVLLLFYLARSARGLEHMGRVLLASGLVFAGTFATCYVVFLLHGHPGPGAALVVYSVTVLAGAISTLPGGGQGVVQYVFHFAAVALFTIPEADAQSMVLHITLNFYLGVATSCLLALMLRPRR